MYEETSVIVDHLVNSPL